LPTKTKNNKKEEKLDITEINANVIKVNPVQSSMLNSSVSMLNSSGVQNNIFGVQNKADKNAIDPKSSKLGKINEE